MDDAVVGEVGLDLAVEAGQLLLELLETMQRRLLEAARRRMAENTVDADSLDEVAEILGPATAERGGGKFVRVHLADRPECDAAVKRLKATVRCIPLDGEEEPGSCVVTGLKVNKRVIVAKAY